MATISRSQTKIDIAYRKMKKDLKKRIPPFYFIMGDITDPYFHQKLWRNFHLVVIILFFPFLPAHAILLILRSEIETFIGQS